MPMPSDAMTTAANPGRRASRRALCLRSATSDGIQPKSRMSVSAAPSAMEGGQRVHERRAIPAHEQDDGHDDEHGNEQGLDGTAGHRETSGAARAGRQPTKIRLKETRTKRS